ncbi:O-antigen translocase [Thiomicrorhabdus sediminis]|uniref:O-antigen translocase n=1 Tax=Thiomicrorhabdus sediminis TaxID=2580412 RepID=A0A4P9K3V1_9GAMM|nr:O-antigen translocase [Thiomicrorhabdus sediminis]QCU89565.1 O-antigen translocase [Thiomicrorhabdus sediminis]
MTLIKTSVLSFAVTLSKLVTALVINKLVAVYAGPSGLAVLAQFQNIIQVLSVLSQSALNNGVTKFTAEYKESPKYLGRFFGVSATLSLISTVLVSFCCFIFSDWLASYLLKAVELSYLFKILSFSLILIVSNNLILSILNGLNQIKQWALIQVSQSIFSLLFVSVLSFALGLEGILIALVTFQALVFIVLVFFMVRSKALFPQTEMVFWDINISKKLLAFALIAGVSAVTAPLIQVLIREYVSSHSGLDVAGYWQAVWYLSSTFLLVVTTTLSTYFLPKFSACKETNALQKELYSGLALFLPLSILAAVSVYFLRDWIIWILFSDDFLVIGDFLFWQLTGDVIRVSAWFFAFLMLAKAKTKALITSEIVFSCSLVLLSILGFDLAGIYGLTVAFAINYFLYLVYVSFYVHKYILNGRSHA